MTKAEIVSKISDKSGLDKNEVQLIVENFMDEVINSLKDGQNVYLRGFGSFIIKTRAEKTGRNISKNTTLKIPAHNIPAFKPAKVFVDTVKEELTHKIIKLCQAEKKEKDIKWLTTNAKKERELIVTKRKSSVILLFLFNRQIVP